VNPLPGVTLALAADTFCTIDGPTPLSGGLPAGGTYSGPGVSGNAFDAGSVGTGTYAVVYTFTDANGCSDSASQLVTVEVCMGTPDVGGVSGISVMPNPNNGEFMLTFNVASEQDYVLEIHNTLGEVVYSESLNNFSGNYSKEINLVGFGRGTYSIRLRSDDKETVIRVVTF
jgi:hypothetical protein